jgi:hypothetical protein
MAGTAPGTVVRCPSCDSVLMVFVKIHDRTCVDLMGLAPSASAGSAATTQSSAS